MMPSSSLDSQDPTLQQLDMVDDIGNNIHDTSSISESHSDSTPNSSPTSSSRLLNTVNDREEEFRKKFESGLFGKKNIQEHFIFQRCLPEPSKKVILECKYCFKELQSNCSNNFERHILQKHENKYLKNRAEKRAAEDDWFPREENKKKPKLKLTDTEQIVYKRSIVDLICRNALPFSLVDTYGWKEFMQAVAPQITVQCRRTVIRDLEVAVKGLKPKIKTLLSGIPEKTLHLTLDMWSSRHRQSVIGIRCQFISKTWQLRNVLIAFSHFPGKHSGEAILMKIRHELAEVGIVPSQISCVCADNASNITRALNMVDVFPDKQWLVQEEDEAGSDAEKEIVLDEAWGVMGADFGLTQYAQIPVPDETDSTDSFDYLNKPASWERKRCIAHTLQLAINDALKNDTVAKPLLSRLQSWINFFRRSAKWTEELKSKTGGLDLKQAGGVRWNAMFFALERFVKDYMLEGMTHVFSKAKKEKIKMSFELPTEEDFEDATELVDILRPLKNGTDFFQKSGLISSSVIGGLLTIFKETHEVQAKKFANLQSCLLKNLEKRFADVLSDNIYILASLLDPNQKTLLFDKQRLPSGKRRNSYNLVSFESFALLVCLTLSEKDSDFYLRYFFTLIESSLFLGGYTTPPWSEEYPKFKCPSRVMAESILREEMLKERMEDTATEATSQEEVYSPFSSLGLATSAAATTVTPMHQMQQYFSQPRATQPDVALDFWRSKEREFPILAMTARRYLSVPATSADVERLFSVTGFILRARRSSLTLQNVENVLIYREYREMCEK